MTNKTTTKTAVRSHSYDNKA